MNQMTRNYRSLRDQTGFTIIELLVSLAIIGLITGVVVYNQSDFSDQLSLSNVASEIDLQIREAQTYGVSVREFVPTNNFNLPYGVSFNFNNNPGASNSSFISFVDHQPTDGVYNTPSTCVPGPTSECLERFNLTRGNVITGLCVINSGWNTVCTNIGRIDITFVRPNPNAEIIFYNNTGNQVTYLNHRGARINLASPKGETRSVFVYTTGQIAVQ